MANSRLKALRVQYGFNQNDMAKLLNQTVQTYNAKENGRIAFTQPEIDEILKFFSKKYEDIFFNKGVPEKRTKEII